VKGGQDACCVTGKPLHRPVQFRLPRCIVFALPAAMRPSRCTTLHARPAASLLAALCRRTPFTESSPTRDERTAVWPRLTTSAVERCVSSLVQSAELMLGSGGRRPQLRACRMLQLETAVDGRQLRPCLPKLVRSPHAATSHKEGGSAADLQCYCCNSSNQERTLTVDAESVPALVAVEPGASTSAGASGGRRGCGSETRQPGEQRACCVAETSVRNAGDARTDNTGIRARAAVVECTTVTRILRLGTRWPPRGRGVLTNLPALWACCQAAGDMTCDIILPWTLGAGSCSRNTAAPAVWLRPMCTGT
jgi:hypothetical protein